MPISKIKTSSITADAASVNLNIDAGTLFLDATNNRVGINTTTLTGSTRMVVADATGNGQIRAIHSTGSGLLLNQATASGAAYILQQDNAALAFATNNTERMRIDSSGNVGIGTASPSTKLEVAGNAKLTGTNLAIVPSTATSAAYLLNTNTGGNFFLGIDSSTGASFTGMAYGRFLYSGGAYPMVFLTNDTERMRLDSSGNLGIGNTSPPTGVRLTSTAPSASGYNLFLEQNNGLDGYLLACTSAAGAITFSRRDTSGTNTSEKMRLDSSGNLGIGTSSPSAKLDVYQATAGSNATKLAHVNGNGIYINPSYNYYDAYNHIFRSLSATTTYATIDNSGNLGIGIAAPVTRLQVVDSGGIGGSLTLGTDQAGVDGGTCTVNLIGSNNCFQGSHRNVSSPVARINMFPTNLGTDSQGAISFHTRNPNASGGTLNEVMRITSDGYVGIGTNAPASPLDVTFTSNTAYDSSNTLVSGQNTRMSNLSTTAGIATTLMFNPKGGGGGNGIATISGVNTATGSTAITFGTRDAGSNVAERVRILSSGVLKSGINSYQSTSEGGVATWNTTGFTNNNSTITFDIAVPDDNGTGTGHHVEANHTHIDWTSYGAFLDAWYSTRGTSMNETRTIFNITSGYGGAWSVSKPNNTTLRVTKSAGTYPGGGYYWIKVTTVSTI